MTDLVRLGLTVDSQGFVRAKRDMDGFQKSAERTDKTAKSTTSAVAGLARAVYGLVAAYGGLRIISSTVRTFSDFQSSMAQVQAITRASATEMSMLTDVARELGATTEFTGKQAADALRFLGMAGFTASESMQAIPDVLNLATAASMDLARSADIASNIMSAFGIAANNAASVTDVLAAAASRANTDVEQLGTAMAYAGPVAQAMGVSINDAAAAIGVLSDAGIQGGMAGTGLRRVLSSLANPTKEAADVIRQLGINIDDVNPASNEFRSIIDTIAASGITAAEALTIFGDRGGPAILALVENAPRLGELTEQLKNVTGESERMAETMRDTLSGDMKTFVSAIQDVQITLGETFNDSMRGATQNLTEMARAFGQFAESDEFIKTLNAASVAAQAFAVVAGTRVVRSLALSAAATIKDAAAKNAAIMADRAKTASSLAAAQADLAAASAAAARVPGFYLNAAALAALTAAEQRAALATAAHTAAMGTATTAAGLLRGAYALIGGHVGAAVIAAAGIYMFLSRAREAAQPTLDLTEHVDQLTESFRKLGTAQREQAAIEAAAALEKATKRLAKAQAALAAGAGDQIRAHEFWTETYRLSEDQLRALRIEVELAQDEFNRLSAATSAFSKIDIDLKTKEFLEYNGWVGDATEQVDQATESQNAYAAALAHVNKILPLVLSNYEKIKNSQSERAYRDIATALAEERAALHMTNKEQDIYNFLKSEAAQKMLPEHRQAIIDQISALHDEREALAALAGTSTETAESMTDDVGVFGTAWSRGVERMRDVIGDFFQQIVVDGNLSFRSLLDGFKRLIAEMIATAAANKVMVSLGLAGASGSALASGAGSALSGGAGLASVGGVLTSIEGLFAKSGIQAGADFMYGLQTQFANAGSMVGGGMGAGLALTAGAGVLGGMAGTALGEALFGKQAESQWGAAIGGIAGAAFGGPLGSAIGAALGGALDAAFGGDGKKRVTLGVETDPMARAGGRGMTGTQIRGASGLLYTGRATRADGSAADELVMMFAQIDDALTAFTEGVTGTAVRLSGALKGSSSQAGLSTQDSGINSFFGAADFNSLNQKQLIDATGKFIDAWLEAAQKALGSEFNVGSLVRQYSGDINAMLAFIDAFGQLMSAQSIDPVRAAMDAQIAANRTLLSNYDMITGAVESMAGAYDGSLDATQALTAALSMQQQTAYQLASAYLEVQTRVDSLFGGLSENIRMSLMSEQELYDYQRAQIEALSASIDMMSDPETIMRTAEQIEAQITQVWGRLDEEQRKVMGPEFLSFIDQTNQIAQDKLKEGLESVETTQAAVLQTIQEGIQSAASTMQLASNTFMQGANMLVSYAESVSSRDSGQLEVNR